MPILDTGTGEPLEHRQLQRHPRYKKTWNGSYSNRLVRMCQGIGKGSKGPKKQCVKGTDTFRIIQYEDIPVDRCNEIAYNKVVCEYRAHKEDPNQTWITIGGNRICYPEATLWAMPVMDTVTGETLKHRQLRRHPKYKKNWNQ